MCKCAATEKKQEAVVTDPEPCHLCSFPINSHEKIFVDNVKSRGKQHVYYHIDCVQASMKRHGVSLPSKEETNGSSCQSCKSDLVVGKCLCGDEVCVNCSSWCMDCDAILCPEECLVVCVDCGGSYCHSCAEATQCSTNGCDNYVCKHCAKTTYYDISVVYGNKPGELCKECFCTPERLQATKKKREALKNEVLKKKIVNNSKNVHTLKKTKYEATTTQESEVEKTISSKTKFEGVKWTGRCHRVQKYEVICVLSKENYQKQKRGNKRPFVLTVGGSKNKKQCLSKVGAKF